MNGTARYQEIKEAGENTQGKCLFKGTHTHTQTQAAAAHASAARSDRHGTQINLHAIARDKWVISFLPTATHSMDWRSDF